MKLCSKDSSHGIHLQAGSSSWQMQDDAHVINAKQITFNAPTINIHGTISNNQSSAKVDDAKTTTIPKASAEANMGQQAVYSAATQAAEKAVSADEGVREKQDNKSDTSISKQSKDDTDTTNNSDKEKLKYYLVKADGTKQLLTSSFGEEYAEVTANFNLADYFEDERWKENEELDDQKNMIDKKSLGVATLGVSAINMAYTQGKKHQLIERLTDLNKTITSEMPKNGGVLIQADYEVANSESGTQIYLSSITPIKTGQSFQVLIKDSLSGPMLIEQPMNSQMHWEFLYIWVTKDETAQK